MNLTILIATRNSAKYLAGCLLSARRCFGNQPEVEFLIVDACSTDATLSIADDYVPHARVVRQATPGLYGALNDGVRLARGERILFLHSDDLLLRFDRQLITCSPDRVHYGHTVFLGADGGRLLTRRPPMFHSSWLRHFPFVFHPNAVYPRALLCQYPFDPERHGRKADMAQIACLARVVRFQRTNGIEYGFRMHSGSTSVAANRTREARSMLFWIFRCYLYLGFEDQRVSRVRQRLRGERLWQ